MNKKETVVYEQTGDKYYKIKHSSGLQIIVYPKPEFHTTYAVFGTRFGSIDCTFRKNSSGETVTCANGTAHFLEHKLFDNEKENAFERYAKTGASANAYTSFDKTCYLFYCTDNALESLKILLDFVTSPYFTKETVEKEQGIIGQEIKMYDDDPQWRVMFNMISAMFSKNPVRNDIAGSVKSISEITPEMLYEFYNAFYNLNNMVLCVAGNIEKKDVLAVADRILKPAKPLCIERIYEEEPENVSEHYIEQELLVSIPLFELGFKESCGNERPSLKEIVATEIILDILSSDSSPLYRRLLESGLINDSSFDSEFFEVGGCSAVVFSGESKDPEKVKEEILKEIDKLKTDGIKTEDFERVKRALYGKNISYLNSAESIGSSLISLSLSGFELFDYLNMIAKISYDEVSSRLSKIMNTEKTVLSVIKPISK